MAMVAAAGGRQVRSRSAGRQLASMVDFSLASALRLASSCLNLQLIDSAGFGLSICSPEMTLSSTSHLVLCDQAVI